MDKETIKLKSNNTFIQAVKDNLRELVKKMLDEGVNIESVIKTINLKYFVIIKFKITD